MSGHRAPRLRLRLIGRWGWALAILALSMSATLIGWCVTNLILEQKAAAKFEGRVREVQQVIRTRLELYTGALLGAKGLYAASQSVERDEFQAYFALTGALDRYPGLLAVDFVERVGAEQQPAFLERVRTDTSLSPSGYPAFAIHPAPAEAEAYVVTYVEPDTGFEGLYGVDLRATPARRQTLERARDTGTMAMTERLILLTDEAPEGFLVALPVYRNGAPHATVEERRRALLGFVVGVFDAKQLFDGIFRQMDLRHEGLAVEVFDREVVMFRTEGDLVYAGEDQVLFDTDPERIETAREHARSRAHALVAFPVADRAWSLHFIASEGFGLDPTQQYLPWVVLIGGGLLSLLLSGLVYMLATSRARATRLAEQMTSEMRKQQDLLLIHERAIASTTDGVIITDPNQPDNPVVYCNQGFERLTGYSGQEVLGKNCRFLLGTDRDQEGVAVMRAAIQARRSCRVLLRNYKKDGAMYWNELSVAPVLNEQGRLLNFVGISHDMTEHKRLEEDIHQKAEELGRSNAEILCREKMTQSLLEDLQTSKQRLEQQRHSLAEAHANLQHSHEEMLAMQLQLIQSEKLESIGRLAAGVAHEVKNPLAVILMGVTYLTRQMANGDPNVPMVLKEIDLAVRRADTVIRGLLDFSAPSELHLNAEDLNAVIDQALLLVTHELQTAHVTVTRERSSLPPVNLDGNKIQQVFLNLFMNAAHAMPGGGTLTIRTCVKPRAALAERMGFKGTAQFARSNMLIVAEVEDTGAGIPEEKLQKVFDPFFTTKPAGKGTGLGLTVTKKIVELHGGLINVRNRPEGGVRVTVVFA